MPLIVVWDTRYPWTERYQEYLSIVINPGTPGEWGHPSLFHDRPPTTLDRVTPLPPLSLDRLPPSAPRKTASIILNSPPEMIAIRLLRPQPAPPPFRIEVPLTPPPGGPAYEDRPPTLWDVGRGCPLLFTNRLRRGAHRGLLRFRWKMGGTPTYVRSGGGPVQKVSDPSDPPLGVRPC